MQIDPRLRKWLIPILTIVLAAIGAKTANAQYGAALGGAGPVNRSMAGVATAAPVSAAGALFWNPATMPGFRRSELEFGVGLLFPHTEVASSVPAGALGPGVPPVNSAGTTNSDSSLFALPTIGLAYVPEDSNISFGLGLFAAAGLGVDYAGGLNPIVSPPPPNGIGFGPIFSEYQVLQITPAIAWQVTDRFSVAAGPTVNLAMLKLDPAIFAAPDNANGDAFATYPSAGHSRMVWGGGFILGAYYQGCNWNFGASVKSPQWFDSFRYNSADELGRPRSLEFDLDLPMIVSVGTAFTGFERWVIAADVRYFDYENADGFDDSGFAPNGAVRGLGWKSIFAVAVGAQYQWTDSLSVRFGYSWNENPIPDSQSVFNVAAPTLMEHAVYCGATWHWTDDLSFSVAYSHFFENSGTGPFVVPGAGPVAGTSVTNTTSADILMLGATVRFGGCRGCVHEQPLCDDCANRAFAPDGPLHK